MLTTDFMSMGTKDVKFFRNTSVPVRSLCNIQHSKLSDTEKNKYIQFNFTQTTQDELNDLTDKFESLEQKYNTLLLESNEYKQHIVELQHQNEDLKRELTLLEQDKHNHLHLKPFLSSHISAIEGHLSENDIELQRLSEQVKQQSDIIKSLRSENNTLSTQNDKYRIALESNNKQKEILKKSAEDIRFQHSSLQSENSQLRDELHHFHMKLSSLQMHSFIKSPTHSRCTSPTPVILPDATPRIRSGSSASQMDMTFPMTHHGFFPSTAGSEESDGLSIDLSGAKLHASACSSGFTTPKGGMGTTPIGFDRQLSASAMLPRQMTPVFGSPYVSSESNCPIGNSVHILANRVTQYGIDMMDSIHEFAGDMEIPEDIYEELEALRMKCDELEQENIILSQKLVANNMISHSDQEEKCEVVSSSTEDELDHDAPYKMIQEDCETTDDDDDMEELWEKCHGELLYHASEDHDKLKELEEGFIEKFRVLWWEFRLHQVNKPEHDKNNHHNPMKNRGGLEIIPESE